MAYFDFEGHKCYYEEHGEGKALIFLHDNMASGKMFEDIIPLYAKERRVIVLDFCGHGRSDRIEEFPADIWYWESAQLIALIEALGLEKVDVLGIGGGAIVAIDAALERPNLIGKIVADSFEGERHSLNFYANLLPNRQKVKEDAESRAFYEKMHGADWEEIVDNDTWSVYQHANWGGIFFRKPLAELASPLFLSGSEEDSLVADKDFYAKSFESLAAKVASAEICIFKEGARPSAISNGDAFAEKALAFLG